MKIIKENLPWEVDAEKLEPGFNVEQNMNRLMTTCKEFLDIIVNSRDRIPKQFRVIFNYARKAVGVRFPEMMHKMVGAFFFLRFLCPAIVTPDRYGLAPAAPPANARRGLVLVSKLLQNLANHQEFDGAKEDYMAFSNEFIKKNSDTIKSFFDQLSQDLPADGNEIETTRKLPSEEKADLIKHIHSHLKERMEKAEKYLKDNQQLFLQLREAVQEIDTIVEQEQPKTWRFRFSLYRRKYPFSSGDLSKKKDQLTTSKGLHRSHSLGRLFPATGSISSPRQKANSVDKRSNRISLPSLFGDDRKATQKSLELENERLKKLLEDEKKWKLDLEVEIKNLRKLKEEENRHTDSQVTKVELQTELGEVRERQKFELEKIRVYFEEEHRKKSNDVQLMMCELETEYSQKLEEERVARMLAEADIRDVKSTLEEQMRYSKRMEIEIEKLEQRIAIERTEKIMLERGSIPPSLLKDDKDLDLMNEKKFPRVIQRAVSVKDRKLFFEEKIAEKVPIPTTPGQLKRSPSTDLSANATTAANATAATNIRVSSISSEGSPVKRHPSISEVVTTTLKRSPSQTDTQKGKVNFGSLTIPMSSLTKEGGDLPDKLESPRGKGTMEKKLKVTFSKTNLAT